MRIDPVFNLQLSAIEYSELINLMIDVMQGDEPEQETLAFVVTFLRAAGVRPADKEELDHAEVCH